MVKGDAMIVKLVKKILSHEALQALLFLTLIIIAYGLVEG